MIRQQKSLLLKIEIWFGSVLLSKNANLYPKDSEMLYLVRAIQLTINYSGDDLKMYLQKRRKIDIINHKNTKLV